MADNTEYKVVRLKPLSRLTSSRQTELFLDLESHVAGSDVSLHLDEPGIGSSRSVLHSADIATISIVATSAVAILKLLVDFLKTQQIHLEIEHNSRRITYKGSIDKQTRRELVQMLQIESSELTLSNSQERAVQNTNQKESNQDEK